MSTLPVVALGIDGWCLRPWAEADAPSLARHANDREVWRFMSEGFPHPYTLELAQQWVRHGHVDFGGDNWAVSFEGQAVGGAGLHQDSGGLRCNAEIGYWIGQSFWGRGVGRRVAAALTQQAFNRAEVTRVFAPIHADNPRSMRVVESIGFVREALLRRSAIKDGRVIDRVLWATFREEA